MTSCVKISDADDLYEMAKDPEVGPATGWGIRCSSWAMHLWETSVETVWSTEKSRGLFLKQYSPWTASLSWPVTAA